MHFTIASQVKHLQTGCCLLLGLIVGAIWGINRAATHHKTVVFVSPPQDREVWLVSSGDLRPAANQLCWPTQEAMERKVSAALEAQGYKLRRAHQFNSEKGHGFIDSQRYGMQVFEGIPSHARLIVAESVWQYSHHVLAGLRHHRGPILTLANFEGKWPGLVGLLNLNGGLLKAGVAYSSLWSVGFDDAFFKDGLSSWLRNGRVDHNTAHVRAFDAAAVPARAQQVADQVVANIHKHKVILGVFDEGCMGMYNAIIDDEMLNPMGIYKERLSQSALYAAMREVDDKEAEAVYSWLKARGMTFHTGNDDVNELTEKQILEQCKMYIAAVRISDAFGCDAIGIQYQQGLKDLTPASDLVEGVLNNVDRPPVTAKGSARVLYEGAALPHFNEVDEGSAVDAVVTNHVWNQLGLDPATTLHDLRWGEDHAVDAAVAAKAGKPGKEAFVWVFEISGAAPPSHFVNGWKGTHGKRQPKMYFPRGGSTVQGVSKPGEIVWSRVYVKDGGVHADIGRATVVELPAAEIERRLQATTPVWPIMSAVVHGVSRDQMMARHPANHIQVAYGKDAATADEALAAKAAAFHKLGIKVHLAGTVNL